MEQHPIPEFAQYDYNDVTEFYPAKLPEGYTELDVLRKTAWECQQINEAKRREKEALGREW